MTKLILLSLSLLATSAHAQELSYDSEGISEIIHADQIENTGFVPIGTEPLSTTLESMNRDAAAAVVNTANLPLYVVLDITRGVTQAKVFKFGKLDRAYPVHGGRNQLEKNSKGEWTCSFTSVGRFFPTGLELAHKSSEHKGAMMYHYVELDESRGMGTHEGSLNSFSGGCIRQSASNAKKLYNDVKAASKLANSDVLYTEAVMDIVDNTPGIREERLKCLSRCRKKGNCITPHLDSLERPIKQLTTGSFTRGVQPQMSEVMRFSK
jgi:hypothetical protein